jgi:chaperone required for assembly of F1-ATPase
MTDETPDERMRRLITGQFNRPLPRKFYKQVEVSDDAAILLDGRLIKTPLKNRLQLPSLVLAQAVAAEWDAQVHVINIESMPLTKLANTALDRVVAERAHVLDEVVQYAGSDLICYWADRPPELVDRQRQHWHPVLKWINHTFGTDFRITESIQHLKQDQESLSRLREFVSALNNWQLTGLYLLMTLTSSAFLALMLQQAAATPETIWAAAHVDEDYQISQWGEDAEAAARRTKRKLEFDGLVKYFRLLEYDTQ